MKRTYSTSSNQGTALKRSKAIGKYQAKQSTVRTSVAKTVQRAITNNLEKKSYTVYGANTSIATASGGVPASLYCLPVPSRGTDNTNRIGNKIKVVYSILDMFINILPYNVSTNPLSTPVQVKIWICKYKLANVNLTSSTNVATDFFEINGANTGFQGNMLDMVLPVNEDAWTVLESRQFKIGASSATTGGAVGTSGYFDQSEMSKHVVFDLTKYTGRLLFNDGSNVPTNNNLFCFIQSVYADGSSSAISCAEVHYAIKHKFIDA